MKFISILIIPLFFLFSCTEDQSLDPELNKSLTLISPNGGEVFYSYDNSMQIKWTHSNVDKINILYSIDYLGIWTLNHDSINASYEFGEFSVPNIIADSIRLRIVATEDNSIFDDSDGFFSIKEDVLNYFPLNIGDVKIFKRKQQEDHLDFEPIDFIVKQTVVAEEFLDNQKYFHISEDIIDLKTSAKSNRNIYFRVDTISKIVYWHSLNPDGIFIHLGLLHNEVFEIGAEHYTTLKEQNSIQLFHENFERKSFFRGDIYGYSGHRIELLDGIGVYVYSYSADYGFSVGDTLTGAVVNGKVYGDTTWVH